MNIFKQMFAMPEVITTALAGADKLVLTKEERQDFLLESAKVLGPQNVARRIITLAVTAVWLPLTLIGAGLILGSHGKTGEFLQFYITATVPFGVIISFYYGVQVKREGNKQLEALIKKLEKDNG